MRSRARFAAWLYTGPLGHLYAGLADWVELLTRWWLRRLLDGARTRRPG